MQNHRFEANGNESFARSHDVIVIGGGPAGAATATLLAQSGRDVALFERSAFPRFHVGESLIPAVNVTLERLGVLDQMDAHRFPAKHGVQFYSPRGAGRPFYFREVADERMHSSWQVLRSDFDHLLLENAVKHGVARHENTSVESVVGDDGVVTGVVAKSADGTLERVGARVVVDASGQAGVLAGTLGGREVIPNLQNTSVYAHFEDVTLDDGEDGGSTLIFRIDTRCWLWLIPLPDAVSVGLVAPARRISEFGASLDEILETAIAASPDLSTRMANAKRSGEVRAIRDFSYRATREGGPGWCLVGDALGFIDPMYSTGLFLALRSAELGAAAVHCGLEGGGPPDLTGYAAEYHRAFDRFLALVNAFYSEDFRFGEFGKNPKHRQGLVDLLTGIVDSDAAVAVAEAIEHRHDEQVGA